jgi:hypothetical protein
VAFSRAIRQAACPPSLLKGYDFPLRTLGISAYHPLQKRKLPESGAEANIRHAKRLNVGASPAQMGAAYEVRLVFVVPGLTDQHILVKSTWTNGGHANFRYEK